MEYQQGDTVLGVEPQHTGVTDWPQWFSMSDYFAKDSLNAQSATEHIATASTLASDMPNADVAMCDTTGVSPLEGDSIAAAASSLDAHATTDTDTLATDSAKHTLILPQWGECGGACHISVQQLSERPYSLAIDDCMLGGLLVMAFAMTLVVNSRRRLLLHHLKDYFGVKKRTADITGKESTGEVSSVWLLATISALSLSIIHFNDLNAAHHFMPEFGVPYWVLGMGFVAYMLFIYSKAWLYTLINWVFVDLESRQLWMRRYFFITSLTAFILYPMAVVYVLSPIPKDIATWGVFFVWALYEILLFYRLSTNFTNKKYAYVLIMLYFCTVELMPALILWNGLSWASDTIIVNNILY